MGDPHTAWIITDNSVSSFSKEIKDRFLHFVEFHQWRLKLLVEVAAATCNVSLHCLSHTAFRVSLPLNFDPCDRRIC